MIQILEDENDKIIKKSKNRINTSISILNINEI